MFNDHEIKRAYERGLAEGRDQLPEGMKHCTILFKECKKGHGWLTATNWVQHECPTCERDRLKVELTAAHEALLAVAIYRQFGPS